jgi:hypothetical protein
VFCQILKSLGRRLAIAEGNFQENTARARWSWGYSTCSQDLCSRKKVFSPPACTIPVFEIYF